MSLTSVACKAMEGVIVQELNGYLDENLIISGEQFGFRKAHSTVDQCLLTYDDITKMIDKGRYVDLVFFDYSKAFDKVNHTILLKKQSDIGIYGFVLCWVAAFLSNRVMSVKVAESYSDCRL